MSSETDHPRQRTVAELLAQHGGGDAASTGRRRRRREADDPADDPGGGTGPAAGAPAAPADWPPQPAEPVARDRSPGPATGTGWDSPRPPAAPAQQFSPPPGAGQPNGAPFGGGTPARGAPTNGAAPTGVPNGSSGRAPDPPATGQRGAPARREPDRGWPSGDPTRDAAPGYWPPEPEPDPRRGQRPDQQPTSAWDAQPRPEPAPSGWEPAPRPSGARETPPWEPAPADSQVTGQRGPAAYGAPRPDKSPREQPHPRAFPPGPEQLRGGPPPAQSPHAGSAPLAASASPFAPPRPSVDQPTAKATYPARPGIEDPGLTGPIDQQRLEAARQSEATSRVQFGPGERRGAPVDPDGGPPTAIGVAPPGAEDWHRSRTGQDAPSGPDPDDDGGPATQAAKLDLDDLDDYDELEEFGGQPAGLGRAKRADASGGGHEFDDVKDAESAGGQSWAPVLAQWVVGAIGGAALWVGFRFLWSNLLVVAIAAAVLVTVGLVIVVRTLLRNRDLRTTLAAVLVGILLTVSPAVLVLLGR